MKDYSQGKIYKLYSVSNKDLIYYGSTTLTLNERLSRHISDYKRNSYCKSKLVIAAGDYKIELIEEYPCANKQQLDRREGEYTKANKCVNKQIAGRTDKEWREDNKEYIKEYTEQYYEDNKEVIAEKNKEYYENNKEAIAEKKKEYYEKNKEYIKEQKKEYYENNREKRNEQIKAYNKVKVTCECGCIIRKGDLATHKKTNKHLELMK